MNNRFIDILKKLYRKTSAGVLKWQTTADEDAFRIGLGNGIIRINQLSTAEDEYWRVRLFDAQGREVESVVTSLATLAPDLSFLPELFQLARRSALDIDSLLTSIDKDIEAGKSMEIDDSPKGDEDIPF
jgi:hypothetical protein